MAVVTAADLGIPPTFNAATVFVDRHGHEGRGSKVALECGSDRLTYGQVADQVNRFGRALIDTCGVRPEERVMLLLLDGFAFAAAFWGTIKAGAVAVPVNTLLREADYRALLTDSRASVLVVSAELWPSVKQLPRAAFRRLRHVIVVGAAPDAADVLSYADLIAAASPELDAEPTSRDDHALWLYSSGSTGVPKGCVHLHHDLVLCAELFGKGVLGIRESDRCFSVAKLFFAYGLGNALYFPFHVGATSILWPGPPTAAHVYRVIEKHRPTLFFSVPTGYAMLQAHTDAARGSDYDLSSIRLAISAGEALPPAVFERFKSRFGLDILDGIGSTEALHMFIANRPDTIRLGSSGQLVDGYDARILDGDGRSVPDGEIGNLWVRGDSVCAGYWNRHDLTRETIEGGWLRTGDKYSRDADGFYWFAGRSDDLLKVGGQWVSPMEVENALLEHPDVLECGVVGREDADALVKPAAFIVLRAGTEQTPAHAAALEQFVRGRLADFKRPRWFTFLPELPKTATGKIQRFKLRELARASSDRQAG
jgi:benzoate-CoA ligase family protein